MKKKDFEVSDYTDIVLYALSDSNRDWKEFKSFGSACWPKGASIFFVVNFFIVPNNIIYQPPPKSLQKILIYFLSWYIKCS
jgi:hypothetical protein